MKKVVSGSIITLALGTAFAMANKTLRAKNLEPKVEAISKKKFAPPKPQSSTRERKDPALLNTGSFTFLSGMMKSVPAEVSVKYDGERYDYRIIDDGFPVFTNSTEVAVVSGEEVAMQIEGVDINDGKSFEDAMKAIASFYKGYEAVTFGANKGYKYINGDNVCIALPIDFSEAGYLLVSLIKEHKCDMDFSELHTHVDVIEMISSITVSPAK